MVMAYKPNFATIRNVLRSVCGSAAEHCEARPEEIERVQTSGSIAVGKGGNEPGQRYVKFGVIVREQEALGHVLFVIYTQMDEERELGVDLKELLASS
jgi:hypothetical protein